MTCGGIFYRALPYFYGLICILELISNITIIRVVVDTWPELDNNETIITTTTATTATTTSGASTASPPPEISTLHIVAFSIAFAGSIVPVFTALILVLSTFFCCICLIIKSCRRPFLRFISLNCDCPCYIPRPKLRFTIRIGFHILCILLRVFAVVLYEILFNKAPTSAEREVLHVFLFITAVSLVFPFLTILLDLYHYRVWWAYQPDIDIPPDVDLPPDFARKPFSGKHKRFIPYVLLEQFRTNTVGNRKCTNGDRCEGRDLEHVVIFHSSDYQPQPRWLKSHPIYIGFHRTTPHAAFMIAKDEFRPSGKGMLGPGAYFARSTNATLSKIGKPDQTGAWFVAEIFMGKVLEVEDYSIRSFPNNTRYDPRLHRYVATGEWSNHYDTCYFNHHADDKDEFCIKNPAKQILRWVVVIEAPYDKKLSSYGLDTEFNSRACGCI